MGLLIEKKKKVCIFRASSSTMESEQILTPE